jgi:hypothetical protein
LASLRRQASARPSLRRATRAAAAAPNSSTIGGAGTLCPPVDELVPPLDDELELVLLLVLDELLLDPEVELLVLVEPPKLLEPPVAPELVEVDDVLAPPLAPELVEVDEVLAPPLAPELVEEVELEPPWLDEP